MNLSEDVVRFSVAIVISIGLAFHGLRKGSLSTSGALAAVTVGFLSMASSYRNGLVLILFYYTSSKLTHYREDVKSKIEEDYHVGGQRGPIQVFACSILATVVAAILFIYLPGYESINFESMGEVISLGNISIDKQVLASYLHCMYIAHYATATGDTWASELGVLSKSQPRLITSLFLKAVPPGTNGGMSLSGTLASVAGGIFIGLIYYVYDLMFNYSQRSQLSVILFSMICGLIGSIVDSLLGATVQATYYSKTRKCIAKSLRKASPDDDIVKVAGINLLSNEAVNFFSILITMALSVLLANIVF